MVHGHKVAKAHGEITRLNGDIVIAGLQRRDLHGGMAALFLLGQQGDEGSLQRGHAGALQQLGGCAGGQNPAIIHGGQPVKALGLVHIGRGHDHAHLRALAANAVDQIPELRARQRVHAGRGLIQNQQVGVVDEGAAQRQLLLHAARELAGRAGEEFLQSGALGQIVDARPALGRVMAEKAPEELQILLHRQRGVEVLAQALRHVGNARADGIAVLFAAHIAAQRLYLAALQGACAGNQRQQAGFAHAVRADQADHDACRNLQAQSAQRLRLAVGERHIAQGGYMLGHGKWGRNVHEAEASPVRSSSLAGHSRSLSSLIQATPGRPVLT